MKKAASRVLRLCTFRESAVSYGQGLALQDALQQSIQDGSEVDTVLCLQHASVFTIGKRGGMNDFRQGLQEVTQAGAEIHTVPRGGEVTYHGPGQCIIYPIMNVRSFGPRAYVDALQQSMIATLRDWGIHAHADRPKTAGVSPKFPLQFHFSDSEVRICSFNAQDRPADSGMQVWVGERKIGAVGVRFSRGVSTHGLALNVDMDLDWFGKIVPCGDPDAHVTSMADQLGRSLDVQQIHDQLTDRLLRELQVQRVQEITPKSLYEECGLSS